MPDSDSSGSGVHMSCSILLSGPLKKSLPKISTFSGRFFAADRLVIVHYKPHYSNVRVCVETIWTKVEYLGIEEAIVVDYGVGGIVRKFWWDRLL